jgi:hypothetical protein
VGLDADVVWGDAEGFGLVAGELDVVEDGEA